MTTPPEHPPAPPGDEAGATPPRACPATKKSGKPCGAPLKPGELACYNHDPARAALRAAAGALRQGDPGTELGSYEGLARRAAGLLEELERGAVVTDEETGEKVFAPKIPPVVVNAKRGLLRLLVELVAKRDKSAELARTLKDLEMTTPGKAPSEEAPRRLEDLV